MTRQRVHRRAGSMVDPQDPERLEDIASRLGVAPTALARELGAADAASRVRAMDDLQAGIGNAALGSLVSGSGRAAGSGTGQGGTTTRSTELTVSRDSPDVSTTDTSDQAIPLDTGSPSAVTESVGPVAESSYQVTASSLADVAAVIGGRSEAGHVDWGPTLDFHQTDGTIDSVTISVTIDLEMPSWTPPAAMLPRARAEWTRWHAALRSHEQGHIDLVHQAFDGLASRLLGTKIATGQRLFQKAKTTLASSSTAYDARTGHGTKQGTIMNVTIEQQEIDEERRKQEEARKPRTRDGAVPDVGDEGGA